MATAPMGTALRQIQRLFVEGRVASLPDAELLERFLGNGDEAAFAALVERHGPMVLGTCRAVLRDPNAAEDAFQATFLVLVCKARSIRGHGALASWLYQVAHRIALQAAGESARRRSHERHLGELRARQTPRNEPDVECREILYEEVARLSDKFRLPLLLCDLEGKTHAQAARELNCGEATIQRRLADARDLLRRRLIRRGVALSVGTAATILGQSALAKIPPGWVEAAVKAAGSMSATAARIAVGDVVSATAADLARKSLRIMLLSQLKAGAAVAVFLIALVGLAWGVGTYGQEKAGSRHSDRMQDTRSKPTATPVQARTDKPADAGESITYQGRVLDPEGHPFAGANLYLVTDGLEHPENPPVRTTSDADGRFRFTVPSFEFDTFYGDRPCSYSMILARAPGYAFGLANHSDTAEELTVQLARDDVPISGRIIDLEGRPVVGASVTVLNVWAPAKGSLDGWLKTLEGEGKFDPELVPNKLYHQPEPPVIPPVKTGADGRFLIPGMGRERVATLEILGPTIEGVLVDVRTRPGKTIRVPTPAGHVMVGEDQVTIHGATFEHVAGPTRPIEGVVRDIDTKTPLSGIMIYGERSLGWNYYHVRAMTDAQGHYRLVGLPPGRDLHLVALAPVDIPIIGYGKYTHRFSRDEELPYLRARVSVEASGGPGPITLDINLKRGVWVSGRVLDKDTGKPVRGQVSYYVFADNPSLKNARGFRWPSTDAYPVGRDGVFHLVAFPGPGVIAARASGDEYRLGMGVDTLRHKPEGGLLRTHPDIMAPMVHHAVAEIDPSPGTVSLNRDLLLQHGRSLMVTVLGPDGKPLAGNQVSGLKNISHWETPPSGASTYTILGLEPGEKRTLTVLNPKRGLAGEQVLSGNDTQPQTMTLQPWGVLTGRIVDADSQPSNAHDQIVLDLPSGFRTVGKDGRFRIEGLIPGKSYTLRLLKRRRAIVAAVVAKDVKLNPGEVRDLGDVVPQPQKRQ